MDHWAFDLIGQSHASVGRCWGLIAIAFERVHAIVMPSIETEKVNENVAAIKQAARASGWAPVAGAIAEVNDVVLMEGPEGRHVGYVIEVDGRQRLLHATRRDGVIHQSLREVMSDGYRSFELWRKRPGAV